MQYYSNNVVTERHLPVAGAIVTVETLAGAAVTVYSDNGITVAPSITTDIHGDFGFYLPAGEYNIFVHGEGIVTAAIRHVIINEFIGDDPVNVIYFGADNGGIADSLSAFNLAADAAGTNGQVIVPKGVYKLSESPNKSVTWVIDANATFTGAGDLHYGRIIKLGNANEGHGTKIGSNDNWLEDIRVATERISEFTCLSSHGWIGGIFGSRSSDDVAPNMSTIGLSSYGINDNATNPEPAWSAYLEARRGANCGPTFGIEIDFVNEGNTYDFNPFSLIQAYHPTNVGTSSIWLSCGGGGVTGANNISQAITLLKNPKKFYRGIVVTQDCLETGEALAMQNGYNIMWYPNALGRGSYLDDRVHLRYSKHDTNCIQDVDYRRKTSSTAPTVAGDFLHQHIISSFNGTIDRVGVAINATQEIDYSGGSTRCSWKVSCENSGGGVSDIGLNVSGNQVFSPASSDNAISLGSPAHRWSSIYAGNIYLTGLSGAQAGMEIGSTSSTGEPYLDFHSSGNAIDYDARIWCQNGSSTVGEGDLKLISGNLIFDINVGTYANDAAAAAGGVPMHGVYKDTTAVPGHSLLAIRMV